MEQRVIKTRVECFSCEKILESIIKTYEDYLDLNSEIFDLDDEGWQIDGARVFCSECKEGN